MKPTDAEREAALKWWVDFQAAHEDWRYADREALFVACWQAARQTAPVEVSKNTDTVDAEPVYVVFDGPPSNESARFIEIETAKGVGVSGFEWSEEMNSPYWNLGPFYSAAQLSAARQSGINEGLRMAAKAWEDAAGFDKLGVATFIRDLIKE